MSVPGPWIALILVGAVFRIWRLLAEDEILDVPRHRLVRLPDHWEEGDPIPADYRVELARFISCTWCAGFWITGLVWIAWQIAPHWVEVGAFVLAANVAVTLLRLLIERLAGD